MGPRLTAATLVCACLLVAAPAASAATLHAAPGSGAAPGCPLPTPCSLANAITAANPGDAIELAPGTYDGLPALPVTDANVTVAGRPGPKPVLRFPDPAPAPGLSLIGGGATLRNVRVEAPNGATPVTLGGSSTVTDVDVAGAGTCIRLVGAGTKVEDSQLATSGAGAFGGVCLSTFVPADDLTIRDVAVSGTGAGALPAPVVSLAGAGMDVEGLVANNAAGPAVSFSGTAVPGSEPSVMRRSSISSTGSIIAPATALTLGDGAIVTDTVLRAGGAASAGATAINVHGGKLRNVTAIASGAASRGLHVGQALSASVKNSIFRGDGNDVAVADATPGGHSPPGCVPDPWGVTPCIFVPATPGGDLTITHSNFRNFSGALNPTSGSNGTGDADFKDAADGDFRPRAGSPLIDAGTDDPDLGPTDLDGRQRKSGPAVDIGAYEFHAPAPPAPAAQPQPQPQPDRPAGEPEPVGPVVDNLAPTLSGLGLTNKRFKVGKAATATAARAKTGTTFVYSLSDAATVTIAIQKRTTGRRRAKRCGKATRRNRRAKKCVRFVAVRNGTLTRAGLLGPNALPFSGRIGAKALKPGKYRAVFSARDGAGNASAKSPSVGFKIVKR